MRNFKRFLLAAFAGSLSGLCAAEVDNVLTLKIFDGRARVLLVHGGDALADWPDLLQRKLDKHFQGSGPLQVVSAAKGGGFIAKVLDLSTGDPKPLWLETIAPKFEEAEEKPVIVLAQQSLRGIYGESREGIRGEWDDVRIRQGVNALDQYVASLKMEGADLVFLAAHADNYLKDAGNRNERLAFDAYMKRGERSVVEGPDVWALVKSHRPEKSAEEGVKRKTRLSEALAQAWFETLLRFDGLPVPGKSSQVISINVRVNENAEGGTFEKLDATTKPVKSRVPSRKAKRESDR